MRQSTQTPAMPISDLLGRAGDFVAENKHEQAAALYQAWLKDTQSPVAYAVYFNLGVTLSHLQDLAGAERAYRQALALHPLFFQAHLNLGTLLERQGHFDAALAQWHYLLKEISPESMENREFLLLALNNLGRLLEIQKRFPEAEAMLRQSLTLNPDQPDAMSHWVHLRQKQCIWPIYQPFSGNTLASMEQATSALATLSLSNDPEWQLQVARRFVEKKVILAVTPLSDNQGYGHKKLRIGYFSSDFCSHAVSILTAELFELHDRAKVDIYGFSWSREDGSALRARVVKALDNYVSISTMTDAEAAQCIRSHEIDILVDLQGLTSGARPNILAYRPAPVQVTYLGFPGTTALPCIDYVIADRFVLPETLQPFFTEKPLYMPHSFQINDRQREIGPKPTRASCSLPEDQFVFCAFNNNFKFTPDVFSAWMRILIRVPQSVLWIIADSPEVRANLTAAASAQGVAPDRLIFSERVAPANYLARYQVADLFLDTIPFNAGTTASDALWAGLPVLTYAGHTFASRMAGSLLLAVNLPELITYDLQAYEDKAVFLAGQPTHLAQMKHQLLENRLSCPLFDSPQFVRDLEKSYKNIAMQAPQEMKQTPINAIHNVEVLSFMKNNYANVVEVGSSSGALALAYRQINPQCHYVGIEIDEHYAEVSKQHCNEVIYGNVEKLPNDVFKKLGNAQCWVFADALEHLYDPWQLLRRIKSNASAGVEVIACIPNAQHWGVQSTLNSGNFFYQDSGLLDRTHIRWLTRITILDLFQANGFQVVEMISRLFNQPSEAMSAAIRQMAQASGIDPDMALQDAIPFQYVVRAVAVS